MKERLIYGYYKNLKAFFVEYNVKNSNSSRRFFPVSKFFISNSSLSRKFLEGCKDAQKQILQANAIAAGKKRLPQKKQKI
jgi:hypothetical protein